MEKLNVMMDIETLSTRQNAAIIQGAIVLFNEEKVIDSFTRKISIDSNMDMGRHVLESTLKFWMKPEQIETFHRITTKTIKLNQFLSELIEQFQLWSNNFRGEIILWCHENFDSEIIKNAFESKSMKFPIKYNNVRGLRSLFDYITDEEYDIIKNEWTPVFPKHDALGDCLFQIKLLQFVWKKLNHHKENI